MYECWQTLVKRGTAGERDAVTARMAEECCAVSVANTNGCGRVKWQKDVLTAIMRTALCKWTNKRNIWSRKNGVVFFLKPLISQIEKEIFFNRYLLWVSVARLFYSRFRGKKILPKAKNFEIFSTGLVFFFFLVFFFSFLSLMECSSKETISSYCISMCLIV